MRKALRQNQTRREVAIGASIPPPVGGWNARDPVTAMAATDAVLLDNWVPRPGLVELRRGYVQQVSGFTGNGVETLIPFRSGLAAGDYLYAANGGKLYDVTTAGALGAAVLSAQTSNQYNYTGFANAAANWTIACNGTDLPIGCHIVTGAPAWAALPAMTYGGSPTMDPTKFFSVFGHKGRLHFLEKNSLRVWNPAAGAVGGAMTLLDLSSIFSKGGQLVAGAEWTTQYSNTSAIFAVYVTDQGQVAVYQGTDPTNATDWALVGVYDLAPPLGPRALLRFGGDLAILTTDGVMPLSQSLTVDRSEDQNAAITNKIMNAFSAATRAYKGNYGWQGITYAGTSSSNLPSALAGSLAIFNVPTVSLSTSMQFVQNVLTGAWCRFLNINAFCWEVANGKIYFGGATAVYQWDQGASDNGIAITGDVCGAYSTFGQSVREKNFTAIRPILNATPLVQPALGINVDFRDVQPVAVPTVVGQGSTAPTIRDSWTAAPATGYRGAPRMSLSLIGDATTPTLAVGDANADLLAIDGLGNTLLVQSNLPFDVPCQLLGFDLLYTVGAPIG